MGMQLYLRWIKPTDITPDILNRLMDSLKNSVKFHEIKLFFIHEHFDNLSVEQLNHLVDIFLVIYKRTDYK